MKSKVSFFFITIFITVKLIGQDTTINRLKNVIPPSPNASAIAKYNEWPVGLYTGTPNIDIPIYELKGKEVSVPISISYHAAGNKVGDIASWVGLGWSLNCGGIISRGVRGLPDEYSIGGYFRKFQLYTNPDDFCSAPLNSDEAKRHRVGVAKGEQDSEQDIYSFSALGKSFKFMFKADGSIVPLPFSNVKILTNFTSSLSVPENVYWIALLEDGTKLEFGGSGYMELNTSTRLDLGSTSFPTSWLLKKITSSNGEEISLTYNLVGVQQDSYFSETDVIKFDGVTFGGYIEGDKKKPMQEKQSVTMLQVATIESDNARVEFIQNTSERLDLKGGRKLDFIKVFSKLDNRYIFQYSFIQDYTDAVSSNEFLLGIATTDLSYYRKRLRLLRIENINPITSQVQNSWKFSYNSQNLPSRRSYAQDHWGFYNGLVGNTTLMPFYFYELPAGLIANYKNAGFKPNNFDKGVSREGNGDYAKAEILENIEYPTGGKSFFYYEANTISSNEEQFTSETVSTALNLNASSSPFNNSKDITFTITKSQNIQLSLESYISASVFSDNPTAKVTVSVLKTGTTSIINGIVTPVGTSNFNNSIFFNLLDAGTYTVRISVNVNQGDLYGNDAIVATGTVSYLQSLGFQNIFKNIGGLRLSRLRFTDGVNTARDIDKYFLYDNPLILNPIDIKAMYFTELSEIVCDGNYALSVNDYKVVTRSSSTRFAFGDIHGGSVGYGKVTTLFGLNGVNGKTVSEFSNEQDAGLSEVLIFPFPPTTPKPWRRGQLLKEATYNAINIKLKQVEKSYEYTSKGAITSFKAAYYKNLKCPNVCHDVIESCYIQQICYATVSEQVKEISTVNITYDQNGLNPLTTSNTNYFDNPNSTQATRIQTVDSKGSTIEVINLTALDKAAINSKVGGLTSNASSAIDLMIAKNMVGIPLYSDKSISNNLLGLSLVNYKDWGGGILAPLSVQMQKGNSGNLETRIQSIAYDSRGNLLEQKKADDISHSYLYDYASTYPIVEAINATNASISATSFEADGKGNWDWAAGGVIAGGITGKKSFNLSGNNITRTGLNSCTAYTVTYWLKNGTGSCSLGGTAVISKNGWTLYQTSVTGITSLTISGNGNIDELRLYPKDAQMTTYTYEPLIGMSSQCDVNNKISYYEYDGFGRLLRIRDQDNNIIKSFDYKYLQTP